MSQHQAPRSVSNFGTSLFLEGPTSPVFASSVRELSRLWTGSLSHFRRHRNDEHLEALIAEALRFTGLHLENDLSASPYWSKAPLARRVALLLLSWSTAAWSPALEARADDLHGPRGRLGLGRRASLRWPPISCRPSNSSPPSSPTTTGARATPRIEDPATTPEYSPGFLRI